MSNIGNFEISSKIAPYLELTENPITVKDFEGNEEVFYWFQELEEYISKYDDTSVINLDDTGDKE